MPKILYIDDDDIDRMVLERYSKAFSFHLDTCHSYASGLVGINNDYQGFIIDWNLGDGDGSELAQKLRQTRPNVPIIFVSGIFDLPQLEEAEAYSPLACIEKVSSPDYAHDILVLLEKHL